MGRGVSGCGGGERGKKTPYTWDGEYNPWSVWNAKLQVGSNPGDDMQLGWSGLSKDKDSFIKLPSEDEIFQWIPDGLRIDVQIVESAVTPVWFEPIHGCRRHFLQRTPD